MARKFIALISAAALAGLMTSGAYANGRGVPTAPAAPPPPPPPPVQPAPPAPPEVVKKSESGSNWWLVALGLGMAAGIIVAITTNNKT